MLPSTIVVGKPGASALGGFLAEHGELGAKLFAHYNSMDEATTALEDRNQGEWASITEFAENLVEEYGRELPEWAAPYFDFERYGRDMVLGGDLMTIDLDNGNVVVFWTR